MSDKDKEIIIDGVDVAGCEFYQIEANELYPKAQYCGSMRNTFCENEPDCYYKQLKRLEQENAELKAENERLIEEKNCLHKIIDRLLKNAGYSKDIASAEDFEDVYENMQYKNNKLEEYIETLQEIKAIATGVRSYLKVPEPRDVRYEMDRILDLITKAEEE